MTENENLKKVTFEADEDLKEMLQQARAEGKRYGDKKFSNRLAYEIGIKVLMGLNDNDDLEAKKQQLEEVRIKKALIESEERFLMNEISRLENEAKQREEEALKITEDTRKLAGRIKEYWTKINVYDKLEYIGFIVTQFKVSRNALEQAYKDTREREPTEEEALIIASKLMESVNNV